MTSFIEPQKPDQEKYERLIQDLREKTESLREEQPKVTTEAQINYRVTKWFKAIMVFVFGAKSPACNLAPMDLVRSACIYLGSSGILYAMAKHVIGETSGNYVVDALKSGLLVLLADVSHRYVGYDAEHLKRYPVSDEPYKV